MEIAKLSATDLAAAVRGKRLSAREVVSAFLTRIEELNPRLNAIVDLQAERALAAAAAVDDKVARGEDVGRLVGVPLTIKSSIDVAGLHCECGSRLLLGRTARKNAPLVDRLIAEDAIILGVSNTPDLLMAYETENFLYGRTSHPLNPDYTAGGSSGGEAAAIAGGMSAAGFGSDGGGSVRAPAHFCGLFGLKPTPGMLPRTGHFPACVGPGGFMGLIGPMARTAADLDLLFETTVGPDPGDAFSIPALSAFDAEERLRDVRIGWFIDDKVSPVSAETAATVEAAAQTLEREGFDVRPIDWDFMGGAIECWRTLFAVAARTLIEPIVKGREHDVHPLSWDLLGTDEEVRAMTYPKFLDAWVDRDGFSIKLAERMEEFPLLLCPVASVGAFEHGRRKWNIAGREVSYPRVFSYSQVFNMTGNPAAVAPFGRTAEGMPLGVQIVGRRYEDALVLALAKHLERV